MLFPSCSFQNDAHPSRVLWRKNINIPPDNDQFGDMLRFNTSSLPKLLESPESGSRSGACVLFYLYRCLVDAKDVPGVPFLKATAAISILD